MEKLSINDFWEILQDFQANFEGNDLYWGQEQEKNNIYSRYLYSESKDNYLATVEYTKKYADDGVAYKIDILNLEEVK